MAFDAGLSFGPGQDPRQANAGGDAGPSNRGMSPIQDAIRILSLKIPHGGGMPGAVNPMLLNGQGAGGFGPGGMGSFGPNQNSFMQFLARYMVGQGNAPSAPTPNVTPGIVQGDHVPPPQVGYQIPPNLGGGMTFDPSQRSPNTGVNGGANTNTSPVGGGAGSFTAPSFRLWGG